MNRMLFVAIALASAVALGCDRRDNSVNNRDNGGAAENRNAGFGDNDFVHDLSIANKAEVDLGKLVLEKSPNPEVKKFAQMMIDDHSKAQDSLMAVASRNSLTVPTELDDKHRDLYDKLAKLQGADFDREYMDAMVNGHQDVVDKLESRVDKKNLADWKTQYQDRVAGKRVVAEGDVLAIMPEKSDNPVTMAINEWAADTYPVAYGHMAAAKTLQTAVKDTANKK